MCKSCLRCCLCGPCECNKECCKKIPIKRYFLPLIGILILYYFYSHPIFFVLLEISFYLNKYLYNNLKTLKEFEKFLVDAHTAAQSGSKLKNGHKIEF